MAVFKCKMCGGVLDIREGQTTVECDYCSTVQTLPRLDTERRAQLYDRANHHLRNNDYDKAMGMYESILNEDSTDAEAYWLIVLCRFGISYVKDPLTGNYYLTVNRMLKTSIKTDADFKAALTYAADEEQKAIYVQEAAKILAIQQKFDAIYKEEEPFDIFISYKETDENGKRTPDSVLAYDLYHQLTQEGFKVFFSRVTLESIIGTEYEPYIFAALNSSKVMVVLGTKPQHFNAVWVKNEWSRYLALIHNGEQKVLIPAYKDMDPYDMPDEFQHLQAQDMSKLGFMQDLIRGINKIVKKDDNKQHSGADMASAASGGAGISQLLKRATLFLEDGEWEKADEYCERVLDIDPENAMAYLTKLCVKLQVTSTDKLSTYPESIKSQDLFQKAFKYADEQFKKELAGYELAIQKEIQRKEDEFRAEQERRRAKLEAAQKEAYLKEQETKNNYFNLAQRYEAEGNYIQAAKCYFRAGNIEGVRKTYNFSKKIALGSIVAAVNPEGKIYSAKSFLDIISDAYFYEACTEIVLSDSHFAGLRKDGTVVAGGKYDKGQGKVSDWKDIVCISAANGITVGLRANGTIVSTEPKYDNLGWTDIADILTCKNYLLALRQDGTVVASDETVNASVSSWTDIVYIAASGKNVAGITKNGRIVANKLLDERYLEIDDAMVVSWNKDELYVVDCRGKVHSHARNAYTHEKTENRVCDACGYINTETFEKCPLCGADNPDIHTADLKGADALENIFALTFSDSGEFAALSQNLSVISSVVDNLNVGKSGKIYTYSGITDELRDDCDKLFNTIVDNLKTSHNDFSEYEYDEKQICEKENGKIVANSALLKRFQAVCEKSSWSHAYLYKKFVDAGYTSVHIHTEYDTSEYATKADHSRYDSEMYRYVHTSYSTTPRSPTLLKTGLKTTYKIHVLCNSGTNSKPDKKANKLKAKSSSSSSSKKVSTGKLVKLAVFAVVAIAIAIFAFSTGNYPGGDGFIGDVFRTFSNNVSDIKQTFGIEDKDNAKNQGYYIMSSDYDSINIRTGAGSDNSVLTKVKDRDQKLYPTGETSDEWIQITINGETGWVHTSVVEFVDQ